MIEVIIDEDKRRLLFNTIGQAVKDYTKETAGFDNQARYNQGKLLSGFILGGGAGTAVKSTAKATKIITNITTRIKNIKPNDLKKVFKKGIVKVDIKYTPIKFRGITYTKNVLDNIAKVTEKQLNDIYIKIQQNIPFEFIPNTLEHKAQRWVQYKESGGDWNYSRWSNTYNANMDKARSAHKKVTKYYDDIKFNCTTKNCKEVSVDVIVNGKLKKRRLDIGDENPKIKKGIEIKSYETGKVYATKDILQEIEADKYLIEKDGWNIEWVFIETEISKPLEKALKNANIKITFK